MIWKANSANVIDNLVGTHLDEFYKLRALALSSEQDLLEEAMGYIYYYSNLREHSSLDYQTPFACLKQQQTEIDDAIRYVRPIMLDKVAVALGPWSGYNVLAQHLRRCHSSLAGVNLAPLKPFRQNQLNYRVRRGPEKPHL
jgi:hypothetical protein